MLYYFIRYMAALFTVQCVYFYKSNSDEIRTPPPQVEFTKEASQFQNTFWENHDLTEQPVITSVYWVREVMHTWYCLCYFLEPSCNGPETELKRKIGIRENISLVFYHIKTVGA